MSPEPTREPDRPKLTSTSRSVTPEGMATSEYAQRTGESGAPVAREAHDYQEHVLGCLWLPIAEAAFCLACEAVFRKTEPLCPACASAITTPLLAFLAP